MTPARKPYHVSDEEWHLVAPYLALVREDAGRRQHPLWELFNGLRYVIRYGIAWRAMPNDLPPWAAVYQQTQRWMAAGCFETLAHDLRAVLRLAAGREAEPSARRRRSQAVSIRRDGSACRQVTARRARDCTMGFIANWPISMPPNTTTHERACGRAACSSGLPPLRERDSMRFISPRSVSPAARSRPPRTGRAAAACRALVPWTDRRSRHGYLAAQLLPPGTSHG
jgi:transposase